MNTEFMNFVNDIGIQKKLIDKNNITLVINNIRKSLAIHVDKGLEVLLHAN